MWVYEASLSKKIDAGELQTDLESIDGISIDSDGGVTVAGQESVICSTPRISNPSKVTINLDYVEFIEEIEQIPGVGSTDWDPPYEYGSVESIRFMK